MKEKFEHKLTNRIREVFDNHQAAFNSQDWEDMKSRLSDKQIRKLPLPWTFVKAASILLLLTAGLYIIWDSFIKDMDGSIENISITQSPSDVSDDNKAAANTIEKTGPQKRITSNHEKKVVEINDKVLHESAISPTQDHNLASEVKNPMDSVLTNLIDSTGSKKTSETLLAEIIDIQEKPKTFTDSSMKPVEKTPSAFELIQEIPVVNADPKKQKIKLGVEIASFTNYSSEDIAPSMNYGGGLIANIPVKSRLSFNPGLIITAYNVNFNSEQKRFDNDVITTQSVQDLIENDPDLKPTGVNLTGIDIPVNFQYRFMQKKKSGYFVELGISNLVYLSENYTYSITKVSGPDPFTGTQSEETITGEKSNSAFETFDFAKLINFSLGWNYRLNNRFDLSLNPYIKYPVGSLGSREVKFGSGGLKMKLMVRPGKK